MKKLWFRAKRYGYGWYPVTWQGWLILAVFVVLNVWNFFRLDETSQSNSDTIRPFVIQAFISVIILILICRATGEPARWRWGEDK